MGLLKGSNEVVHSQAVSGVVGANDLSRIS
jgi:hypothetical protein